MREVLTIAGVILLGCATAEVAVRWDEMDQAISSEALAEMKEQTDRDARRIRRMSDPELPHNEITAH